MKKILVLFLLLLAGCSDQPSHPTVQYYTQNPQQLESAILQCKDADNNSSNVNCEIIAQAAQQVRELAIELATNQESFGAHILASQMKLADLQQQLQQAKENHDPAKVQFINQQITKIQAQLNARLAVIKLLTKPSS